MPTQTTEHPAVYLAYISGWYYGEPYQRLFGVYQDPDMAHLSATTWIKRNPGMLADSLKNDEGDADIEITEQALL